MLIGTSIFSSLDSYVLTIELNEINTRKLTKFSF